jgi:hypothetical protein
MLPCLRGERDELGPAVVRVGYAVRVADLLEPLHLPGNVRGLYPRAPACSRLTRFHAVCGGRAVLRRL